MSTDPAPNARQAPPPGWAQALPTITSEGGVSATIDRLAEASKRGRMAGFVRTGRVGGSGAEGFETALFGTPFDRVLVGRIEPDGEGSRVHLSVRMPWLLPGIFAASLVVSVWPGVVLLDHLIPGDWGWWPTWMWYLPLTIPPIPYTWWWAMKRTDTTTHASCGDVIAAIAKEVGGQIESRPLTSTSA